MKLKVKRETLIIIIGIFLLLVIAGFIVYSINFLLKNVREGLSQSSLESREITRFNLEGLKKIGEIVEIEIPFNNNGIIHLGTTFLPEYREKCSQEFDKFLETVSINPD